ncbi:MAG: fibrobacter succinogenes major paralogous domain-containing protein [Fibrobacteraceae bacterium]|nr:fibrobacter succinogenes major paralogous domain-containing protein [Fibrobacteraceae bacterium]
MIFSLLKKYIVCTALLPFVFACSDAGDRVNVTDPANEEAYAKYMAGLGNSSSSNEGGASNCVDTLKQNAIHNSCTDGATALFNNVSTSYNDVSLTCQNGKWYATGVEFGSFADERDGQIYKTVKIGEQTWMAENLNYEPKGVPSDVDSVKGYDWSGCYDSAPSNCETYGRLYTWGVVMNDSNCTYLDSNECNPDAKRQGICPEGWHVPTDKEFGTLYKTIGDTLWAGQNLKSANDWSSGTKGYDIYGFSVLPAGFWGLDDENEVFKFYKGGAYLWSSSQYGSPKAFVWVFIGEEPYVKRILFLKAEAASVRCIKD